MNAIHTWAESRATTPPPANLSADALIFGLAHPPFGIEFAAVATVAGLGYGWAAWKSGSRWPAIALHWLINLLHVSPLSHPMLA